MDPPTAPDATQRRHSPAKLDSPGSQGTAPETASAPRRGPGDNAQPPTRSAANTPSAEAPTPPPSPRRPTSAHPSLKRCKTPIQPPRRHPCRVYHPTPQSSHRPRRSRHRAPPPRRTDRPTEDRSRGPTPPPGPPPAAHASRQRNHKKSLFPTVTVGCYLCFYLPAYYAIGYKLDHRPERHQHHGDITQVCRIHEAPRNRNRFGTEARRVQRNRGRRAAWSGKPLSAPFCGFWKNRTIFTFCGSKFTCIFCLKSLVILNFHS